MSFFTPPLSRVVIRTAGTASCELFVCCEIICGSVSGLIACERERRRGSLGEQNEEYLLLCARVTVEKGNSLLFHLSFFLYLPI